MIKKLLKTILLAIVMAMIAASPVLAAYYATIQVTESNGNTYAYLPYIIDIDNEYLADEGFIDTDGLDTRVQTQGGVNLKHLLSDDKTLFAIPSIGANTSSNYLFSTGNAPLSSYSIITGYDGYFEKSDDADMELGNDFEIEADGYVDTDAGANKNIVYKDDAFRTYIDGATNITSAIVYGSHPPVVEGTNGGFNKPNTMNHTVNLPAGIVAGELLLVVFNCDYLEAVTWPGGWTESFEEQQGGSGGNTLAVGYKVADGGEGASITVTTDGNENSAYQSYRISGYSDVPEFGNRATAASANPNPPAVTPSWGARNTLFITIAGWDGIRTVNAYPANYTDGRDDIADDVDGCGCGSALRENNVASEDAGQWTLSSAENWIACTLAIAPDELEVTATGISSGEHTVTTSMDYPFFGIDVDGNALLPVGSTGGDLVFNAPLWQTELDGSPFTTIDDYAHSCTVTEATWGTQGRTFDGINDKIDCGNPAVLQTDVFTITTWVKFPAGEMNDDNVTVFGKTAGNSYVNYNWGLTKRDYSAPHVRLTFYGTDGSAPVHTDYSIAVDTWVFVAATLEQIGADQYTEIFLNGVSEDTNNATQAMETNRNVYLGASAVEGYANITIGEARMYDRILSTPEIQHNYQATKWKYESDTDRMVKSTLASVPDNGNTWYFAQNNVMPYIDYYKHTVGGSEIAWYQPNDIIVDAGATGTLPDRQATGGSEDATITWGTNPAGLADSTSGLSPSEIPTVSTAYIPEAQDVILETDDPGWLTGIDLVSLQDLPVYPIVEVVDDLTDFNETQIWRIGATVIMLALMMGVYKFVPHLLVTLFVGAAWASGMVTLTIYPFWVMFIFIAAGIALLVWERQPSI